MNRADNDIVSDVGLGVFALLCLIGAIALVAGTGQPPAPSAPRVSPTGVTTTMDTPAADHTTAPGHCR